MSQNEQRQIECLKAYGIDKWFSEKISGKDMNRPQLQELLKIASSGDTIYISDFSRLARNTYDLLLMTDEFQRRGINLISVRECIDISTPLGKLAMTMISAVSEFERQITFENQQEGIAIAKAQGKYRGGKEKRVDEEIFEKSYAELIAGKVTKSEFAKRLGVSRPTLDKLIKQREG